MALPRLRRGKADETAVEAKPRDRGRSLLGYFLPVVAVALVLVLVLVFYATQRMHTVQQQAARVAARGAAQNLAGRVSGLIEARQGLLALVSQSGSVRRALAGKDPKALARTAASAQRLLSGALRLRLFPKGVDVRPDPQGKAPMGFAGVDMVRRALAGRRVGAEIHQIDSGHPYIALARPVREADKVVGAVFVAWPLRELKALLAHAPSFPGELWLVQGGADGYVIGSTGTARLSVEMAAEAVPGTDWQVFYSPDRPATDVGDLVLWGIGGAGLLILLLVAFLQQGALARALRADMATLISLGEALAGKGQIPSARGAGVTVCRDAVLLMRELARRGHGKARPAEGKAPEAAAGRPQAARKRPERAPAASGIKVEESNARPPVAAPEAVFRAYDIRGRVKQELTQGFALGLGWAFAERAHEQGVSKVYVAHDARVSSPDLYEALCAGLSEIGIAVMELGMAPAGLLYYAMHQDPDAGAVLVTGSHNPPEYNGFKLYLRTEPVQGEALSGLGERMRAGGFEPRAGSRTRLDLLQDYLDAVAQNVSLAHPMRVVVDGGNGAAGELAVEVLENLGCEVIPLYCEPDGRFPHHHPDPGRPENLEDLQREVVARAADIGLAFDGDGDRIGVVDGQGVPVRPEHLLMKLAADILQRNPGSDVVYDVKSSRHLAGFILAQGGRPVMWRSGHTRMKEKMRDTAAILGGEYAGHFYIRERWSGSDDAVYVAARLLEVFADDGRPVQAQVEELPHGVDTPEYQLPLAEGESARLMQAIVAQASFPEARLVDLDGLRVEFPDAWGLVRASNTLPSLTFRFEADTPEALEQVMQRFRDLLGQVAPGKTLPF